jgi:hypothetical protein
MAAENTPNIKDSKKIAMIVAVVVVGSLLAAAIVFIILSQQSQKPMPQGQSQTGATSSGQASPGAKLASPPSVAVKQTLSYVGKIQSLSNSGFSLLALAEKNKLSQDKVVQVKVSNTTKYTRVGGEAGLIKISFKDLAVGDMVIVFSNNDVIGQDFFGASTVQKIK